jgi:lipocalin
MGSRLAKPSPVGVCIPIQNLNQLNGTWNEMARITSWFEPKTLVNATATYEWLPDGTLDILNRGQIKSTKSPLTAHAIGKLNTTFVNTGLNTNTNSVNTNSCPIDSVRADFIIRFDGAPFDGSYIILDLGTIGDPKADHKLEYLIVGTRDKSLLWILTRSNDQNSSALIQEWLFDRAKTIACKNGYSDTTLQKLYNV